MGTTARREGARPKYVRKTNRRMDVAEGLAVRSPRQIAQEWERRTGQRMSDALVYAVLKSAQRKIAKALIENHFAAKEVR